MGDNAPLKELDSRSRILKMSVHLHFIRRLQLSFLKEKMTIIKKGHIVSSIVAVDTWKDKDFCRMD